MKDRALGVALFPGVRRPGPAAVLNWRFFDLSHKLCAIAVLKDKLKKPQVFQPPRREISHATARYSMRKLLILLTGVLLLGACKTTRYEMQAPASDAGRACVEQCAEIRERCRSNEIRRARSEREACEHRAEASLHACIAGADNRDKLKECDMHKPGCWSFENYTRCEEDYRACYAQCGGTVTKIVE